MLQGQGSNVNTKGHSVPDLELRGHTEDAEFALGCCDIAPTVASGGQDASVLIWNLLDHESGALSCKGSNGEATSLRAQTSLQGHSSTVEDVCWQPGASDLLASVGDDQKLLLWDLRFVRRPGVSEKYRQITVCFASVDCYRSPRPTACVQDAHGAGIDIHCVDWSCMDSDMLATACAGGVLKIWDRRKLQRVRIHHCHEWT